MARTKTGNSQIDAIRKLMADGESRTIDQVAKALKLPRPNVSVALANGVKSKDFVRVSTGVYRAAEVPGDWEPLSVNSDGNSADNNVLDKIVEGMTKPATEKPVSVFATDDTEPTPTQPEPTPTPQRATADAANEESESAVGEQITLTIIANINGTDVLQDEDGGLWRLVALRLSDA